MSQKRGDLPKGPLDKIAAKHGTDKWGSHWYTPHYHRHFLHLRRKPINLLEIGVGGYASRYGGRSLRMWKQYFPKANIFALDIFDKKHLEEDRITIFQASQTDRKSVRSILKKIGEIDICIDDGSHVNMDVIQTFEIIFPYIKFGGLYVVEDMQTSYWPFAGFGGSSIDLSSPTTTMGYFKQRLDGLNFKEFDRPGYHPSPFDRSIVGMHFYHNLLFIEKGRNNEESNIMKGNRVQKDFWRKKDAS